MKTYILKVDTLEELDIHYLKHNDNFYIPVKYANKVIEFCRQNYIFILGIEGFRFQDKFIMPDMEYIADFSSLIFEQDNLTISYYQSKKFLQLVDNGGTSLFLEFILESTQ